MVKTKDTLSKVQIIKRRFDPDEEYKFSQGEVRTAFNKVYKPNQEFTIFKTTANPKAIDVLKNLVGEYSWNKQGTKGLWGDIREYQEGEKLHEDPMDGSNLSELRFSNSLMDCYRDSLDEIATQKIKKNNFAHYNMVSNSGIHNSDRDPNQIFWPEIYVVNSKKYPQLIDIINNLSVGESFEFLKQRQDPQNYQLGAIKTLEKLKIPAIIPLEDEIAQLTSDEFLRMVDFFAQMRNSYKYAGTSYSFD